MRPRWTWTQAGPRPKPGWARALACKGKDVFRLRDDAATLIELSTRHCFVVAGFVTVTVLAIDLKVTFNFASRSPLAKCPYHSISSNLFQRIHVVVEEGFFEDSKVSDFKFDLGCLSCSML